MKLPSPLTISLAAIFAMMAQPASAESLELLGEFNIPSGIAIDGVEFGGISAIDYDAETGMFLAISDDGGKKGPVRFYELALQISPAGIEAVNIVNHTVMKDKDGAPYPLNTVDPEGLVKAPDGNLYWSQEGGEGGIPSAGIMRRDGRALSNFQLPEYYIPDAEKTKGVRSNLALENLTVNSNGQIILANESALIQDGPKASLEEGAGVRVLFIDPKTQMPTAEYVYKIGPVAYIPVPHDKFTVNGLTEILARADGSFYMLERSFSAGQGNVINLYRARVDGASNVLGRESLKNIQYVPMSKEPVLSLVSDGIVERITNIEGMSFGPEIDGRQTLIMVSDSNFSRDKQFTQFLLFAINP